MTETNPATRRIRYWLIGLLLMSAVVTISYAWLDRPLAYFAHGELRQFDVFERLTHIPEWFAPLAIVFFLLIGLRGLAGYPLAKPEAVMLLCSLSLVTASAIKNQLKIIFGRTFDPIQAYSVVAVVYLVLIGATVLLLGLFERHLRLPVLDVGTDRR